MTGGIPGPVAAVVSQKTAAGQTLGRGANRLDFFDPITWAPIRRVPIRASGIDHLDFSADGSYLLVSAEFSGHVAKVEEYAACEIAVESLQMFVEIYGAMAGNLALLFKAVGGLYVGGGVAPKIIEKLKDGTFMRAYGDKGRMSGLVKSIPVRVILDDKTALYGAARYALLQSA